MLLLLMCGDIAMNPGPVILGSVNVWSIRNKGLSSLIQLHLTLLISSVLQKHTFVPLILIFSFVPSLLMDSH